MFGGIAGKEVLDIGQVKRENGIIGLENNRSHRESFLIFGEGGQDGITDGRERVDPVTLLEIYIESGGYNG